MAITFEIVDADRLSSIAMIFAFGDAAIIDDVSYCAEGSDGCDVISGDIFDFKVGPAFVQKPSDPLPEPSSALLIGLGLAALGRFSGRPRTAS